MKRQPLWRRYLRFFGPDPARDVDEELRFHLDMRIADFAARGLPPSEARRAAMDRFGDLHDVRSECERITQNRERRMARLQYLDEARHDLAYGLRSLLRAPVFTLAAVLSLGLGIGANTAVFSAVNGFLFQPLPVSDPDRLIVIGETTAGQTLAGSFAYADYRDIRARRDLFVDVSAYKPTPIGMRVETGSERRWTELVSGNFFSMLGVRAAQGRLFTEDDERRRAPVVVLSYDLWKRRFDLSPSIIGRTVHLNGLPFTVIGITEPRFHGVEPLLTLDAFVPIVFVGQLDPTLDRPLERRDGSSVRVIGRLRETVTVTQAQAGLATVAADLNRLFPDTHSGIAFVATLEIRSRPDISVAHLMPWIAAVFLALVGLVLVVACANVANLLLARATVRQSEIALRRALGATSPRLARQLLTESVLLSLLGLGVGLVLAYVSLGWLTGLRLATDMPLVFRIQPDWRVFAFTAVATVGAGLLAGFTPALQGMRLSLISVLKEGGRGGHGGSRHQRARRVLVAAQVAVSTMLLVCAGLFTRSVRHAADLEIGFRRDNLLMASTDISLQRYTPEQARQFYTALLERAAAIPGVRSAALARDVPLGYSNTGLDVFFEPGTTTVPDGHGDVLYNVASPDYFATLGLPLVAGREFSRADDASAPLVAIVNRPFVERFWPGLNGVGKRFRLEKAGPTVEVVGVTREAQYIFLGEMPRPYVYLPLAQRFTSPITLHLRTNVAPAQLASAARQAIHALDPQLVVYDEKTMATHLRDGLSLFFLRLAATLAGAVGLLGLTQTIVGLYGVISYAVTQRTREIGIRIALGADAAAVLRTIVAQGMRPALIGLGLGLLGAIGLTRVMAGLLLGVGATDPLTFGLASFVLIVASLVATILPAWRAARLNPTEALRDA